MSVIFYLQDVPHRFSIDVINEAGPVQQMDDPTIKRYSLHANYWHTRCCWVLLILKGRIRNIDKTSPFFSHHLLRVLMKWRWGGVYPPPPTLLNISLSYPSLSPVMFLRNCAASGFSRMFFSLKTSSKMDLSIFPLITIPFLPVIYKQRFKVKVL